ncbi:MAG: ATPase, T2SS/T4P/T4SS family [Kiritimatiellia bacterium]
MYTLHLHIDGEPDRSIPLEEGVRILGRGTSCDIQVNSASISTRHLLINVGQGCVTIKDLHSSNGTFLNGQPIYEETRLTSADIVAVGQAFLRIADELPAQQPPVQQPAQPAETHQETPAEPEDPLRNVRRQIKDQIHKEVLKRLDLRRMTAQGTAAVNLQEKARQTIDTVIAEVTAKGRIPDGIDPKRIGIEIFNEAMRLGPIEDFLADDSVTEIMVNGANNIYVERKGKLTRCPETFVDDASVLAVIERIVAPIGRRIDETQPYVDARLSDGSRVNAIIPPLSLIGPCLTIRKFSKRSYTADDLIGFGSWSASAVEFLRACVQMRKNIVVAGGTGSGKTTLLNVLSSFIPSSNRILTIEDAAELRLVQPHVVRLEARPANIEGRGAITIRDLVKNALRMRPDRIIVGEVRGGEALDMLQAMNTGHDGSLTTVHANSPRDVISRLETMVMMSGMELPSRAIREQIASAVDIIVHQSRMSDGSRKVVKITEIVGLEGQQIAMQDIFEFEQSGLATDGKVLGRFKPTGSVPTFFEELQARGIALDPVIFQPDA